jgi:GT2 family glycosyltransferase
MLTRRLFERVGGFDESLPVCEDYDLWLRIAGLDEPVGLLDEPLVVKRGGHSDQLSRSTWGMDRYRVQAIVKLLRAGLSGERRGLALAVLRQKCAVLAQGARKRGKYCDAEGYDNIGREFGEETDYVAKCVSSLRGVERISPADARPLG